MNIKKKNGKNPLNKSMKINRESVKIPLIKQEEKKEEEEEIKKIPFLKVKKNNQN